jgi:hypothetical protein
MIPQPLQPSCFPNRLCPVNGVPFRLIPPVDASRPAYSLQGSGCRVPTHSIPATPTGGTGASRRARTARSSLGRKTKPVAKGHRTSYTSAVACRTQESARWSNNKAIGGKALLQLYRQPGVVMSWYNTGIMSDHQNILRVRLLAACVLMSGIGLCFCSVAGEDWYNLCDGKQCESVGTRGTTMTCRSIYQRHHLQSGRRQA